METTRKIVLFPTGQFFAIVGILRLSQDPYITSLTDIFNDKSSFTHWARDHVHKSGRVFLSEVEFYPLPDPSNRVCSEMKCSHVQVGDIQAVIDFHPEKYRGNGEKRREYAERNVQTESMQFALHHQVFVGNVDTMEVYRKCEEFVSISDLQELPPCGGGYPIANFLKQIECPQPQFMAVNLGQVFHS